MPRIIVTDGVLFQPVCMPAKLSKCAHTWQCIVRVCFICWILLW